MSKPPLSPLGQELIGIARAMNAVQRDDYRLQHSPPQTRRTVNGQEIVTEYWAKPIPDRSCDWQATYGDYDLDAPIGYGPTEEAAIADLLENYEP